MSGEQAAKLFGRESSSEEEDEEDSSEESSGEQENQEPEATGKEGGGEAEAAEDSSSSSSSAESGSASEGEESEPNKGGVPTESSSPLQQPEPSEPVPAANSNNVLANAQNLFGDSSSSSSSESDDGGGVIGGSGGSDIEEGASSPTNAESRSPDTRQERGGVSGGESPMEAVQSANQTAQSVESEDGAGRSEDRPSQTVEGLFGDAADLSSSDSEEEGGKREGGESDVVRMLEGDLGEVETEMPRINVEIPRCAASLGTDQYFVKLPNFLSVETRPFDPALYEDEVEDENEILDEEGRARLKLKVENTIRWRYSQDETGNEVRESNARVVRWSDGTMSLYLGSEIFDIHRQPLQGEFSHLFVRQGTGLQGQAVFQSKLTFRPHSTDSHTHRKMTLSIADRFSKTQKIRVLPAVGKDPESQKKEKIKKEEERLRAAVRRENQQKRVRERNSQRGLTASYIEPDREDDDDEGASVAAIKSSFRSRLSEMRGGRGGGVWGGAESEGESSDEEEGAERLMRAKTDYGDTSVSRKRHLDPSDVESSHKKQPRRKLLHSDDSEDSD